MLQVRKDEMQCSKGTIDDDDKEIGQIRNHEVRHERRAIV